MQFWTGSNMVSSANEDLACLMLHGCRQFCMPCFGFVASCLVGSQPMWARKNCSNQA